MTEHRGYTCDGGCGEQTVLAYPSQSVQTQGWWTAYGPPGTAALHACSAECLVRAVDRAAQRAIYDRRPS